MSIKINELAKIRRASSKGTVTYIKADINSALQAIEDWFETNRLNISSAIDGATSFSFTNPQKKRMVAHWLDYKFNKEK